MSDNENCKAEWDNPDNWGGSKMLTVYFSKKDPRIWVPKRVTSSGYTVNLAHAGGVLWMVGICVGLLAIMVTITILVTARLYM